MTSQDPRKPKLRTKSSKNSESPSKPPPGKTPGRPLQGSQRPKQNPAKSHQKGPRERPVWHTQGPNTRAEHRLRGFDRVGHGWCLRTLLAATFLHSGQRTAGCHGTCTQDAVSHAELWKQRLPHPHIHAETWHRKSSNHEASFPTRRLFPQQGALCLGPLAPRLLGASSGALRSSTAEWTAQNLYLASLCPPWTSSTEPPNPAPPTPPRVPKHNIEAGCRMHNIEAGCRMARPRHYKHYKGCGLDHPSRRSGKSGASSKARASDRWHELNGRWEMGAPEHREPFLRALKPLKPCLGESGARGLCRRH